MNPGGWPTHDPVVAQYCGGIERMADQTLGRARRQEVIELFDDGLYGRSVQNKFQAAVPRVTEISARAIRRLLLNFRSQNAGYSLPYNSTSDGDSPHPFSPYPTL